MDREADPNVHRNSEPHLFLPGGPLMYVYHTLRFSDLDHHAGEDLGVDVLSHSPSFRCAARTPRRRDPVLCREP